VEFYPWGASSTMLALNPNFSIEMPPGDDDPDPYGQDVMVNHDLQIVLQFVASATVDDFAFQLQNPGLKGLCLLSFFPRGSPFPKFGTPEKENRLKFRDMPATFPAAFCSEGLKTLTAPGSAAGRPDIFFFLLQIQGMEFYISSAHFQGRGRDLNKRKYCENCFQQWGTGFYFSEVNIQREIILPVSFKLNCTSCHI
jgi:hypothetical protein